MECVERNLERIINNKSDRIFNGNVGYDVNGSSSGFGSIIGDVESYEQFMKGRDRENGSFWIGGNGGDLYDCSQKFDEYNPNRR